MSQIFVAEIKTVSPFGFKSAFGEVQLANLAKKYGDWISIHVDELWGGHTSQIRAYKNNFEFSGEPKKPILAKGLHLTDESIQQSLDAGADYVLVVGRIPSDNLISKCLMEPLNMGQLHSGLYLKACNRSAGVVLNDRDLRTGRQRSIEQGNSWYRIDGLAITGYHIAKKEPIPSITVPLFQASGIKDESDVLDFVDGYIVGEHLPRFVLSKQLEPLYF